MQRLFGFPKGWLTLVATDKRDGDFVRPALEEVMMHSPSVDEYLRQCHAILRRADFGDKELILAEQVHGSNIEFADHGSPAFFLDTDGLVTDAPGMALGITAADCVPVLIYSDVTRCVALLHAGRMGVQNDIVPKAIGELVDGHNVPVSSLRVVIGPSICRDHYEVEDTVATPFKERYAEHVVPSRNPGHSLLDLPNIITDQAWLQGVPKGGVLLVGGCTYEREQVWFSYRRDTHHACLLQDATAPKPRVQLFLAVTR